MEHIINRVALDHDLPVSKVREEMVAAIHEGFLNPEGKMREIFGDTEPTPEELIAVLAQILDDAELEGEEDFNDDPLA